MPPPRTPADLLAAGATDEEVVAYIEKMSGVTPGDAWEILGRVKGDDPQDVVSASSLSPSRA
jgi:hypothetical protein